MVRRIYLSVVWVLITGWSLGLSASNLPSAVQQLVDGRELERSGLQLNLPLVSEDGSAVPLDVVFQGRLAEDDTLQAIYIFATANPNPEVIEFHFEDARIRADLSTRIRLNESQKVFAVALSQQGRAWITEREVRVTVSGCLMRSDEEADAGMQNPRIALPRRPQAGQPLELRTLINHPMETGLREDAEGRLLPRNLVEELLLKLDGTAALRVKFHTGTSANPYVRMNLVMQQDAELSWIWTDQQGQSLREERSLQLR